MQEGIAEDFAGLSSNAANSNLNGTQAESAKARGWISSHATPVHRVEVSPFALGKHDVTRGDYAQFVDETRHVGTGCLGTDWKDNPSADWHSPGFA